MAVLRLALAQMNPTVGALSLNREKIVEFWTRAHEAGADLVVTPELALSGYPPEDLLLKEGFIDDVFGELAELASQPLSERTRLVVGLPRALADATSPLGFDDRVESFADSRVSSQPTAPRVANGLEEVSGHSHSPVAFKQLLPNYDVFDEQRYFLAGRPLGSRPVGPVGFLICEDVWRRNGPAQELADAGARVIVVANASPFARGRQREREAMISARARETDCTIAFVNTVGGQDELVFDGQSFVVDPDGTIIARAGAFVEELLVVDIDPEATTSTTDAPSPATAPIADALSEIEEVYDALVLGTRDYVVKNGFTTAVINLSGGVDSSLVTVIAMDAIGPAAVRVFAQPSRYSSEHSIYDAVDLAARCGIDLTVIPIEGPHRELSSVLKTALERDVEGLTDENLQSRIRGVILMAISNDTGALVLTTGNKSELATGYSTLYGDSAGGFAVIKDVPKTLVYELCRWRNERAVARGEVSPIPDRVLEKAPSAELRPGQRDDQSLPPYEVLDPILEHYVEGDMTVDELIGEGFDAALVTRIARLVDLNEYKRRQMPPGVRITRKAFGKDRRMPITNAYRADLT